MIERKFKRIVIDAQTPIAKTGNGLAVGGKVNNLLLLGNGSENSKDDSKRYLMKGIRGWINHAMMALAKEEGVEVCHSSSKTETQSGVNLLPEGFHARGKCLETEECIQHRLMGSISKPSKLKFEPVIIISTASKGKINDANTQKMHIATERRNSLVHKTKAAIQDFGERYFGGEFTIKIEFLEEVTKEELGYLLKGILNAQEIGLGAAVNNGSGKVNIHSVELQEVIRSQGFDKNGKVFEEEKIRNLKKEKKEGMKAWSKANA